MMRQVNSSPHMMLLQRMRRHQEVRVLGANQVVQREPLPAAAIPLILSDPWQPLPPSAQNAAAPLTSLHRQENPTFVAQPTQRQVVEQPFPAVLPGNGVAAALPPYPTHENLVVPATPVQWQMGEQPGKAVLQADGVAAAPLTSLHRQENPTFAAQPTSVAAASISSVQRQEDPTVSIHPANIAAALPVYPSHENSVAAAPTPPVQRQENTPFALQPTGVVAALPAFASHENSVAAASFVQRSETNPVPSPLPQTPENQPEGEGLDETTWQRLSYVMRTHQAMLASGDYQDLSEESSLPSFLSPVQRKEALQRRHDYRANREANKRLTQPQNIRSRKPVQRTTSVALLYDPMATPSQAEKKGKPAVPPSIQRTDAAAITTAPTPESTHAPITNIPITNTPLTHPSPEPADSAFTMRTIAHQEQQAEAQSLSRLMRQVAPAQASDSPVELVLPRTPRPKGTTVQRRADGPKVNPREMVNTEIGELPSDLWAMMGEAPPTATNREAVRGRSTPPTLQRTPAATPVQEEQPDLTGFSNLSGLVPVQRFSEADDGVQPVAPDDDDAAATPPSVTPLAEELPETHDLTPGATTTENGSPVQRQNHLTKSAQADILAQTAMPLTSMASTAFSSPPSPAAPRQRQTETPVGHGTGQNRIFAAAPAPVTTIAPAIPIQQQAETPQPYATTIDGMNAAASLPTATPAYNLPAAPIQRQAEIPQQQNPAVDVTNAAAFVPTPTAVHRASGPTAAMPPGSPLQRQAEVPTQHEISQNVGIAAAIESPIDLAQTTPAPSGTTRTVPQVQRQAITPVQPGMELGQVAAASQQLAANRQQSGVTNNYSSVSSLSTSQSPNFPPAISRQPSAVSHQQTSVSTLQSPVSQSPSLPQAINRQQSAVSNQQSAETSFSVSQSPNLPRAISRQQSTKTNLQSPVSSLSVSPSSPPSIQRDLPITDTPDSSLMETVGQQMRQRRRFARGEREKRRREITMVSSRAQAERNLRRPQSVLVKESDKDSGLELYAERENLRGLKRHTREVPAEEFVPEKKEEDKPKVDIDQVSRQVYQQIRHRLTQEWEQRRARMG